MTSVSVRHIHILLILRSVHFLLYCLRGLLSLLKFVAIVQGLPEIVRYSTPSIVSIKTVFPASLLPFFLLSNIYPFVCSISYYTIPFITDWGFEQAGWRRGVMDSRYFFIPFFTFGFSKNFPSSFYDWYM